MSNTIQSQQLEELKKLNQDLNFENKTLNKLYQNLKAEVSGISKSEDKIKDYKKSIEIENKLKEYPSSAQGSVFFQNAMVSKYEAFGKEHLEKMARFFTFIEQLEDEYHNLYNSATTIYFEDPYDNSIENLFKMHDQLIESYKLMLLLILEVDRDQLLYHKIFNQIEDQGIFLSANEKLALDQLATISNKLSGVINGLNVLISETQKSNEILGKSLESISSLRSDIDWVSSDISSLGYEISDMQSEIWGLTKDK